MARIDGTDEEQTDGQGATESIRLLERFAKEKRPFFLGTGFFRPHVPFVAPKKWFDMYPKESITLASGPRDDLDDIPEIALTITPVELRPLGERSQGLHAGYFASVSFVDSQVGRLLDALDRLGLAENTVSFS